MRGSFRKETGAPWRTIFDNAINERLVSLVSLQLRVLLLGFLQNGDAGIGVFPESEEVLIGRAGFCGVALESVGTSESEMGQSTQRKIDYHTTMVEKLLKLSSRASSVMRHQLRLPPNVDRVHRPD